MVWNMFRKMMTTHKLANKFWRLCFKTIKAKINKACVVVEIADHNFACWNLTLFSVTRFNNRCEEIRFTFLVDFTSSL